MLTETTCPHCPQDAAAARGLSRRSLLRRSAAGGALLGLVGPSVATRLAWADTTTGTPYAGDTLVVLSLRGGFDGLSAIVPGGDADFRRARPGLGVPQSRLLPLDRTFGMHPALAPLQSLWTDGELGVVHAVGMPMSSRSHFADQEEMERAAPGSTLRTGWLDRALGQRPAGSAFQAVQIGKATPRSLNGPTPELTISSIDSFEMRGDVTRRSSALRGLHQVSSPAQATALTALSAVATVERIKAEAIPPGGGAVYPDSSLGKAMRDVARLIKANVGLQAACVDAGNWDMHTDLGNVDTGWMAKQLADVAGSLAAFAADLGTALDRTTLVTLSEFGRRVKENGSGGVDHGHGNAVLMLGGGVRGGIVHGQWPGLTPAALDDGDLAGTTDYRDVLGEVLMRRCGASSLATVFPGLTHKPLGLVNPLA